MKILPLESWRKMDFWLIASLMLLIFIGTILILAAAPPAAERMGLDSFFLVKKQLIFLPIAIGVMIFVGSLPLAWIPPLSWFGYFASLCLTYFATWFGAEINGAHRWINLGFFSLQPSEFLKPFFVLICACLFAKEAQNPHFQGKLYSIGFVALGILGLILQPDLGMCAILVAVWCCQCFIAGLSLIWIAILGILGFTGLGSAYLLLPHVQKRVEQFLNPESSDTYQVSVALNGFSKGGWFGVGPGEGLSKTKLPDAHTDFIFSVAGEEFGLIFCVFIVLLFCFIVVRGLIRLLHQTDLFVIFATSGLLTQFGLQAAVNIASSLYLIPTKGMTLPFISFGGSSLLAFSMSMGIVLALTRRRFQ